MAKNSIVIYRQVAIQNHNLLLFGNNQGVDLQASRLILKGNLPQTDHTVGESIQLPAADSASFQQLDNFKSFGTDINIDIVGKCGIRVISDNVFNA